MDGLYHFIYKKKPNLSLNQKVGFFVYALNSANFYRARRLSDHDKKMWIRHVYVPGIHNNENDLLSLGRFIGTLEGVDKFEILPYHQMGIYKWKLLGKEYPLEGVPSPEQDEIDRAYHLIETGCKEQAKYKFDMLS